MDEGVTDSKIKGTDSVDAASPLQYFQIIV